MRNGVIGIIGFGVVGQAVYGSLTDTSRKQAVIFDLEKRFKTIDRVNNSLSEIDTIFICLPTPTTVLGQDATAIKDTLNHLKSKNYPGMIVIKSTVLYSNIKEYLSDLFIVYNPEFLNANTANADFYEQDYIILGGNTQDTKYVMDVYAKCFKFKNDTIHYELCSVKEAIDFKYTRNMYQAYKVLFWEFVQDNTGNARKMSSMLDNIPMGENSQVSMDGYRGFGGACLPKDLKALAIETSKNSDIHPTLNYMIDFNSELKGN